MRRFYRKWHSTVQYSGIKARIAVIFYITVHALSHQTEGPFAQFNIFTTIVSLTISNNAHRSFGVHIVAVVNLVNRASECEIECVHGQCSYFFLAHKPPTG